jgi:hypothetical protein
MCTDDRDRSAFMRAGDSRGILSGLQPTQQNRRIGGWHAEVGLSTGRRMLIDALLGRWIAAYDAPPTKGHPSVGVEMTA